MNIKVSIITGIYFPPEDLFRRFLRGCLDQTLEGIEFILIFDSPKDIYTREILQSYSKEIANNKNKFIIVENETNLGVKDTHTKGTFLANGEYLMYLDQDDFFDDDYLETMYNYAKKWDANILKGRAITHYYGDLDIVYAFTAYYQHYVNTDDYLFMYNTKYIQNEFEYEKSRYDTHTMIDKEVNGHIEKVIVYELPLYEGTFYHYIRHSLNMSNCVLYLDQVNKSNDDYDVCQTRLQPIVIDTIHRVFEDIDLNVYTENEIKEILRKHIGLDEKHKTLTYDEMVNL